MEDEEGVKEDDDDYEERRGVEGGSIDQLRGIAR